MASGVLSVGVLFGDGLKDGDFLGKSDPYVKVFLGSQTMRTKTIKGGGKKPVWNETLRFNLVSENTLTFEVYDEDLFKDDLLGVATADLAEVRKALKSHVTLPVLSKKSKKQHGTITVDLELAPSGGASRDVEPPVPAAATAPPPPLPEPNKLPPGQPYGAPAPGYPVAGAAALGAAAAASSASYSAPPPPGYPGGPPAAAAAPGSYSGPPPAGYPGGSYSAGPPPPGYPYPGAPPAGYPPGAPYGAPPPGYPQAPPPGYPGAPPPPYGYPPQPGYGYGAPPPPANYYPGSRPGSTVYVQQQPQRHSSGMGAGAGMAMGALGGLAAGLFIADMADGDLFDAGF